MPYKSKDARREYDRKRRAARTPDQVEAERERLRRFAREHPDLVKGYQHKYHKSDKGRATKGRWREKNRDSINAKARDAYHADPDATRAMRRAAYGKTRMELLDLLGTRCANCGFDNDVRALQFDHIHNDGAADRRRFKIQSTMYRYYLKHPAEARRKLQTLCANCNFIKESETEFGHRARRRP